ncbi:DUF4439 domain-containing protein [Arthrobacter russicus]|uniref:DUF4439 domain-containing protein n=1 Tax=Arthrobacter russicus TaxID=172040 RepID=A0ABU1JEB2_9MICC|nr:DUF4439 domain-containing protein [Arthrobacter russicus]MDR6270720.1 hypothetical protein [Arthrobacter russicus]
MTDPETAQNRPDGGSKPGAAEDSVAPQPMQQQDPAQIGQASTAPKKKKTRRASAPAGPPVISVTPAAPEPVETAEPAPPAEATPETDSETPTGDSAPETAGLPSDLPTKTAPEPELQPVKPAEPAEPASQSVETVPPVARAAPVEATSTAEPAPPAEATPETDSETPTGDSAPETAGLPSDLPTETATEPELQPAETAGTVAEPEPVEPEPAEAESADPELPATEFLADPGPAAPAAATRQALRSEEKARGRAKAAVRPGRSLGRRLATWLRRVAMLLLVGILVVALGSSISVRPVEPIGPEQGELARIAAEKDSNTLLAQAKQLSAAPAPAADPALKYAINTLTAATAALARPESSGASAASGPGQAASGPASPGTGPEATAASDGVPPTDLPGLIAGLARAAAGNLGAARSVEPGIARLLAAAGTGQALASQYLAQVTGLPAASIANPATASAPATACAGTLAPLAPEATTAPSTQSALAAVALAEQKSAYAYQLVAARIPSADSSRLAMKLLTSHRAALDAAEEQLRSHCTQPPIREPAFVLDPAFSTQPAAALAMVEDQLSLAYGDLIGLSDGPLRDWAINQLLGTGQNLMLWSPPSRALPGMPE